jgi:hypothetical protein
MFGPKVSSDRRLHVGRHRLYRLLADLGERTVFVDHTTVLPSHAERTGFAGIPRAKGSVELPEPTRFKSFAERVPNRLPSTTSFELSHIDSTTWKLGIRNSDLAIAKSPQGHKSRKAAISFADEPFVLGDITCHRAGHSIEESVDFF